jgi:glycine cleavage system H protein
VFEKDRSLAVLEGGKWVGALHSAFEGVVVSSNDALVDRPALLDEDAFGRGWMLIVRPVRADWRAGLVTGDAIAPAFAGWITAEAYQTRGAQK